MNQENKEKLFETYKEISDFLWEYEYYKPSSRIEYTDEAFASATKIFMSALLSRMYQHQLNQELDLDKKIALAEYAGSAIRELIKQLTGMDSHDFYKVITEDQI